MTAEQIINYGRELERLGEELAGQAHALIIHGRKMQQGKPVTPVVLKRDIDHEPMYPEGTD